MPTLKSPNSVIANEFAPTCPKKTGAGPGSTSSTVSFVSLIVYLRMPETKGQPLR